MKWDEMSTPNSVTEEFLRRFKPGDLVDVRIRHLNWSCVGSA